MCERSIKLIFIPIINLLQLNYGSCNNLSFEEPWILYSPRLVSPIRSYIYIEKLRDHPANSTVSFLNPSFESISSFNDVTKQNSYLVEIGYDLKDNFIFWTVYFDKISFNLYITQVNINLTEGSEIIHANESLSFSQGFRPFIFTYDWIHKLIYKAYKYENYIGVSKIFNPYPECKIISTNLRIEHLAVHPQYSFIFWTEIIENHKDLSSNIWRTNQDGSNSLLLRENLSQIVSVLTIDFKINRLFWFDLMISSINSMDLNGDNFSILNKLGNRKFVALPGSFDSFNENLYLNYNETNEIKVEWSIRKYNIRTKYMGGSINFTDNEFKGIVAFRIVHKFKQPETVDRCIDAKCPHTSHLCLPINKTNYRCLCSDVKTAIICKSLVGKVYSTSASALPLEFIFLPTIAVVLILIIIISILIYAIKQKKEKSRKSNDWSQSYISGAHYEMTDNYNDDYQEIYDANEEYDDTGVVHEYLEIHS